MNTEPRSIRCPETGQARTYGGRPHMQRENINWFCSQGKMKNFSRGAASADSGSESQRPGFHRLSPVRRLRRRLRESEGPPRRR